MSFIEVEFINIKEDEKYMKTIKKVVEKCYAKEGIRNNIYINIILTDNENIKEYNKKFRDIDSSTDVLSFPMFEKNEIDDLKKSEMEYVLGDVIISIPKVEEQAIEYEHSFEREFSYMVVHAFYHLLGYDHINETDKKCMREKEEIILSELKVER